MVPSGFSSESTSALEPISCMSPVADFLCLDIAISIPILPRKMEMMAMAETDVIQNQ